MKKHQGITIATACLLSAIPSYGVCDSTTEADAQAIANNLLSSLGPQSVTRTVTTQTTGPQICTHTRVPLVGTTVPITVCKPSPTINVENRVTSTEILTAHDVRFTAGPIVWGTPTITSVPVNAIADSRQVNNCTSAPQSFTVTMSFQTQQSAQFSISKSVTNTRSQTIGVNAGFAGIGVSGGLSFGNSSSSTTASISGSSNGQTQTLSEPISIPANSTIVAQLISTKTNVSVPFSMNAVIDADISQNDKGYSTISQIFPEAKRTVVIEGFLTINDVSNGSVDFYEKKLNQDNCQTTPGLLARDYAPKPTDKLTPISATAVKAGALTKGP